MLAEAPCHGRPHRDWSGPGRQDPGEGLGSLSGDPTCGPARPPLARTQPAALPGLWLLLPKMLSSGSLRIAVPLLGLQTKRWTLSGGHSGQEDPSRPEEPAGRPWSSDVYGELRGPSMPGVSRPPRGGCRIPVGMLLPTCTTPHPREIP